MPFLRAGHTRFRVIARAWIHRWGWRGGARRSALVRFVPSGELAWVRGSGSSWPEDVEVSTFRAVLPPDIAEGRLRLQSSRWPRSGAP